MQFSTSGNSEDTSLPTVMAAMICPADPPAAAERSGTTVRAGRLRRAPARPHLLDGVLLGILGAAQELLLQLQHLACIARGPARRQTARADPDLR